jgi:hypothetical protein
MSILNFLEKSVGKWFSQRTSYQLGQTEEWHQSDKTNVFQELVPPDAEDVVKLCDRANLDPALAIVGFQTRWEKTSLKPAGSSLLVPLRTPAEHHSDAHILLRGNANKPMQQGTYFWGSDETLIIVTPVPEGTVEERLWFAAENLRLRTSFMTYSHSTPAAPLNVSSFYSEIRLGGVPAHQG